MKKLAGVLVPEVQEFVFKLWASLILFIGQFRQRDEVGMFLKRALGGEEAGIGGEPPV